MTHIYRVLVFSLALLFVSCASEEGVQTVTVDNLYSLTIPAFLSEGSDLHEDASLQYQHIFKEFYVIVIDESKAELQELMEFNELADYYDIDLDGYTDLIGDGLYESLINATQTDFVEDNVNGMPARFSTIDGTIDGVDIYYEYGIYEGAETWYQVIVWTLSDRQDKYKDEMKAILKSLKEERGQRSKPAAQ